LAEVPLTARKIPLIALVLVESTILGVRESDRGMDEARRSIPPGAGSILGLAAVSTGSAFMESASAGDVRASGLTMTPTPPKDAGEVEVSGARMTGTIAAVFAGVVTMNLRCT
jgi:hypothetical protein